MGRKKSERKSREALEEKLEKLGRKLGIGGHGLLSCLLRWSGWARLSRGAPKPGAERARQDRTFAERESAGRRSR